MNTESRKVDLAENNDHNKKFGTFGGVFTPDVLTILGVIMYLRLGWVVGNAGFLGALAIILLAKSLTICTGLSLSSTTTNIKIGAGGAYSIISKSLGLEAGGSIGIPLYISLTFSAALYIIGFTEAWLRIFPHHSTLIVSSTAWFVLLIISYVSAHLAIRVQYLIMAIMVLSLVSFFFSPAHPTSEFVLIGKFSQAGFWRVFAIFFPAVTGIMAGANLSGDLKNPRRSLPLGTMSAITVTMFIYIGIAFAIARISTPGEMLNNPLIMVDKARWAPAVIAGVMGATLSSALGSILGAPRVLQALAEQQTVPFSGFFAKKTKKNEPRNAIILTGIIIELALIPGNLDFLASLITMFFLITYGMLNLVVFIQKSMKIISFRPTFNVPRIFPLLGAIGCLAVMFLINAVFSFIAIVTIVVLYFWLEKRGLESDWGDIRGGLLLVLAERASRLAMKFPKHQITWKPDLLVPIDDPKIWSGPLHFIRSITHPSGSIFAFTIKKDKIEETRKNLQGLLLPLQRDETLVHCTALQDESFLHGAKLVIQTLRGGTFRPNILFLTLGNEKTNDNLIKSLLKAASENEMGTIILRQHARVAFGMHKTINIWLRDKSPNWHLALLITLHLQSNWAGRINLVTATTNEGERKHLLRFLNNLNDQARLPSMTELYVLLGSFDEALKIAPRADINVFGLSEQLDFDFMHRSTKLTQSSCLFVKDSGWESALV